MKTKLFFSLLILASVFYSCKKSDSGTTTIPTPVYGIAKDSMYTSTANQTTVREYDYNTNKQLIRVRFKYGTSTTYNQRDTIIYNSSGQIASVLTFQSGSSTAQQTDTYNYTSGILTSVNETGTNNNGAYAFTRTYTDSAGKLNSVTINYTSGTNTQNNGPQNIKYITYSSNNMNKAYLVGYGAATATADLTAPNPYYGLNYNSSDFIDMVNQNNILTAYLTAMPSTLLVSNTYTYANGRVATINSAATQGNSTASTTVITYKTL